MVRFLINVPENLQKDLKHIALVRGQTLNGLIRQILWEWVESGKQVQTLPHRIEKNEK